MRSAAVLNLSSPHYNLGAEKLANWLCAEGWQVQRFNGDPGLFLEGFDLVCLSAIFSWHVPTGLEIAFRCEGKAEVWAGGPGFFRLAKWWKDRTGLDVTGKVDP